MGLHGICYFAKLASCQSTLLPPPRPKYATGRPIYEADFDRQFYTGRRHNQRCNQRPVMQMKQYTSTAWLRTGDAWAGKLVDPSRPSTDACLMMVYTAVTACIYVCGRKCPVQATDFAVARSAKSAIRACRSTHKSTHGASAISSGVAGPAALSY